jgi:hypothetical protein
VESRLITEPESSDELLTDLVSIVGANVLVLSAARAPRWRFKGGSGGLWEGRPPGADAWRFMAS